MYKPQRRNIFKVNKLDQFYDKYEKYAQDEQFDEEQAHGHVEKESDPHMEALYRKVEDLEQKLELRDQEIRQMKMQNKRLTNEKVLMQNKLKKLIKEDKKKELDKRAEQERQGDSENPPAEGLQKNLLDMLMRAQMYDSAMQQNMDQQREQDLIEKAIQESLKENPNPDVMNYEQLQELEERMGSVSKGFSEMEINLIPTTTCNSTKEDCAVCLEGVKIGEEIKKLSCGHEFHKECINECFKTTKKCPYCMHEHELRV